MFSAGFKFHSPALSGNLLSLHRVGRGLHVMALALHVMTG
jgi:hypothetical protein